MSQSEKKSLSAAKNDAVLRCSGVKRAFFPLCIMQILGEFFNRKFFEDSFPIGAR